MLFRSISEDDVRNERSFAELLPEIENFVEGLPLVAHNASVEKCCIRDVCSFYEIDTKLDYNNILDTLPLSREAEAKVGLQVEGQGTHSLDVVCSRFGVPVLNHHNALEDAEMCGNLMVKFHEILVNGKSIEKTTPIRETEDNKDEYPAEEISQTTAEESTNPKGGCLGVMILGLLLTSIIAII